MHTVTAGPLGPYGLLCGVHSQKKAQCVITVLCCSVVRSYTGAVGTSCGGASTGCVNNSQGMPTAVTGAEVNSAI